VTSFKSYTYLASVSGDTLPKRIMAAGLYGELSGIFKSLATIYYYYYLS
jgi:hypothetical protein